MSSIHDVKRIIGLYLYTVLAITLFLKACLRFGSACLLTAFKGNGYTFWGGNSVKCISSASNKGSTIKKNSSPLEHFPLLECIFSRSGVWCVGKQTDTDSKGKL